MRSTLSPSSGRRAKIERFAILPQIASICANGNPRKRANGKIFEPPKTGSHVAFGRSPKAPKTERSEVSVCKLKRHKVYSAGRLSQNRAYRPATSSLTHRKQCVKRAARFDVPGRLALKSSPTKARILFPIASARSLPSEASFLKGISPSPTFLIAQSLFGEDYAHSVAAFTEFEFKCHPIGRSRFYGRSL